MASVAIEINESPRVVDENDDHRSSCVDRATDKALAYVDTLYGTIAIYIVMTDSIRRANMNF